ncbi:MAG: hypothetical protein ACI9YU_001794 [Flavobacteriales bacterium]|jgi:hypothetical protein
MHNGIVIALAWPETACKQAGAWYDVFTDKLGFSHNGYYKVGHSALVLIDKKTGKCHYADFGRYHAPHGFGRVRTEQSDHDLKIFTNAEIDSGSGELMNLDSILIELFENSSCHGTGEIYGAPFEVDFELVHYSILNLQSRDFIEYGPFLRKGTNCSRFVNSIIRSGKPGFASRTKLMFPPMLTPTPMWNLKGSRHATTSYDGTEQVEVVEERQPILIHT